MTPRAVLLEVKIDLAEPELRPFAREVLEDAGFCDEESGEFMPDPVNSRSFTWYEIPPTVINSTSQTRRVPDDERKRLFLGCGE